MRVLVTGATGFVGSHLVDHLLSQGEEVICLGRPGSRRERLAGLPVELRVAGPEIDPAVLQGAEVVLHAAGLTRGRTAEEYLEANARSTQRLVEAALRIRPGLLRFVYISSLAAAGPCPGPEALTEEDPPAPADHYGASKLAGERAVLARSGDLPVTIVRPPAVYGPRDRNFLPLFRIASRFGVAPVLGDPRRQVSLVHAADLAEGIWRAAASPVSSGRVYFLGSSTHSYREVLGALGPAVGRRLTMLRVPDLACWLLGELGQLFWALTGRPTILSRRKMRDLRASRWVCSWARAAAELGYQPRVGLEAGFAECARWYAAEGWIKPPRRSDGRGA